MREKGLLCLLGTCLALPAALTLLLQVANLVQRLLARLVLVLLWLGALGGRRGRCTASSPVPRQNKRNPNTNNHPGRRRCFAGCRPLLPGGCSANLWKPLAFARFRFIMKRA